MSNFNPWQSGTSAFMALAIVTGAAAPIIAPVPASAQSRTVTTTIPSGTAIPVRYNNAEKIVVNPKETMALTVTVPSNIKSRYGTVLIPSGSQIVGQLQPASGGSQFVARELITSSGRRQSISATSRVIASTQVRKGASVGTVVGGAAAGSAVATAISALTGDRRIVAGEVLIGTGVGTLSSLFLGRRKVDVVVVNPDTDLNLTLRSNLPVSVSVR